MGDPKFKLVNTPEAADNLVELLQEQPVIGLDTESAGPLLRNRKWKGGKTFINVQASTMIGFSVAFPCKPAPSWYKKNGELRKGKELHSLGFYIPVCHNKKNLEFSYIDCLMQTLAQRPRVWMHNAKHDTKVLALAGYDTQFWAGDLLDSSIAAYLHRGTAIGNDLKSLAFEYLGRSSPKFDPTFYNQTGKEALAYAAADAVNTLELGEYLAPLLGDTYGFFCEYDSPFAALLGEMERHGWYVDRLGLLRLAEECEERMAEINDVWESKVKGVRISSDHELQKLFRANVWPDHGERTDGGAYSVNREALEILQDRLSGGIGRELVDLLLEYRRTQKIATTYTRGLVEEARQHPDKKLHPDYRQTGTRTGRLSSANPNGQNIPVRTALGRRVKQCFIPSPGYKLVALDYSQIELRVLAHFAGGKLADAYVNDEDVHQQTCDFVTRVAPCDRDKGKTVNFALQYGASPYRLSKILRISQRLAKDVRRELLNEYPELDLLKKSLVELADSRMPRPYVKTLAGRRAYIDDLLSGYAATRSSGERKAVNYTIQGSAFDIMKIAMVDTRKFFIEEGMWDDEVRFISNVHDEMTMEVVDDPETIAYVCDNSQRIMEAAYQLRVPLKAEPKVGENWLSCK